MEAKPLVSVICLCFNHKKYVEEAISSVLNQTYKNIEIIIVDDGSHDGSDTRIKQLYTGHPRIKLIFNSENLGLCTAFNKAFKISSGHLIVNHACDDVLLPDKINQAVGDFMKLPDTYGVHFTDTKFINENGQVISVYSETYHKNFREVIPSGDVFKTLLERFFIADPSMVVKRQVLDEMGGYDENLSYEDFDFWVSTSRKWYYHYHPEVMVHKRDVPGSLSKIQKQLWNPHIKSTVKVIEKACALVRTKPEIIALKKRINYELKWALVTINLKAAYWLLRLKRTLVVD